MNYYQRHIGDYQRATGHLSLVEHGVYNLLLDRYYATEKPIPADQVYRLARARTDDERAAVDAVLAEFFQLDEAANAWRNRRTDAEIEEAQSRIRASQHNGRSGGRPRKTHKKPSGFPTGNPDETQQEPSGKAHQSPIEIHTTEASPVVPVTPATDGRAQRVVSYCQALIRGGVPAVRVNHADPRLVALADRQPPPDPALIEAVAREGCAEGRPPPWILATIAGRLDDAARPGRRTAAAFIRAAEQPYEPGALTRGELPFGGTDGPNATA